MHSGSANASGYTDGDYPVFGTTYPALSEMPLLGEIQHTSLPPELIPEFDSIHSF